MKRGQYIDTTAFWRALGEGRLALQFCEETGRFQHYPRPVSISTGRTKLAWKEVSGRGVIYAFTVIRTPAGERPPPVCVAIVELDEGVRILANIEQCQPQDLAIGRRVNAMLTPSQVDAEYPAFVLCDA
jgi:uncharacterized OB-fold protein